MLDFPDFRPYQTRAFHWLRHRTEAFVTLRMGLGKTGVAAAVAAEWLDKGVGRRVLVMGSKFICEATWPKEMREWAFMHGYSFAVCTGTKANRIAAVESDSDFLFCSYDHLKWLLETYGGEPSLLPDLLILDESTKLKNHSSKRFRALEKYLFRFKRRVALTGTPAPERYSDLWAQEASISPRRRLGRNISAFRTKFCHKEMLPNGSVRFVVAEHSKREIERLLDPITFNLDPADYFDLAAETVFDVEVGWDPDHRDIYNKMEKDFVAKFHGAGGEEKVEAANVAVALNKLRQLCGGVIYKDGEPIELDQTKLEALDSMVEEIGGRTLIFYQFKWEKEQLLARVPNSRALHGPKDIDDWNADLFDHLILHPASSGHGLNLHHNCSDAIWYSLPWSLEQWLQANARLRAHMNENPVCIYRLLREDSVDYDVALKLESKNADMNTFLDNVGNRHKEKAHA